METSIWTSTPIIVKSKRKDLTSEKVSNPRLNFGYLQLATSIIGSVLLLVFGFYALKLLASFRKGVLETGWKEVTVGAIFLVLAQFLIIVSGFGAPSLVYSLNISVFAMRFVGIALLTLGFRAHYQVWRLDTKNIVARNESNEPLEWKN